MNLWPMLLSIQWTYCCAHRIQHVYLQSICTYLHSNVLVCCCCCCFLCCSLLYQVCQLLPILSFSLKYFLFSSSSDDYVVKSSEKKVFFWIVTPSLRTATNSSVVTLQLHVQKISLDTLFQCTHQTLIYNWLTNFKDGIGSTISALALFSPILRRKKKQMDFFHNCTATCELWHFVFHWLSKSEWNIHLVSKTEIICCCYVQGSEETWVVCFLAWFWIANVP